MRKKIIFVLHIFFASLFFSGAAFADTNSAGALCTGDSLSQLFCSTSLSQMLNAAFQIAISVGGILAMLKISWAGWKYMGSGPDMWSSKQSAKETFKNAIIGLLLLLSIYLILFQINPQILSLNFSQTPASTGGSANAGIGSQ